MNFSLQPINIKVAQSIITSLYNMAKTIWERWGGMCKGLFECKFALVRKLNPLGNTKFASKVVMF